MNASSTAPSAARRTLLTLLCILALTATACGDTADTDTAVGAGETATATATAEDGETVEEGDPVEATEAGAAGSTVTPGTDTMGVEVSEDTESKPEITLPDGEPPTELVVVDIVEGDGEEVPVGATVTTDYVGVSWTNDGEEFDSSWDRGQAATFGLDQVIPGWTQGIPGMKVGGRRLLIIPPDLGYGSSPPPGAAIAPDDTLVFVIDLVEVVPPPEPVTPGTDTMGVEVSEDTESKPEITLPDGEPPTELVVVDIVEGDGEEVPVGATVTTDYVGVSWTNDGEEFDSSWDRGQAATFGLDQVIPGWTQGIPGMKVGGRRLLIIPPDLGYGSSPPPGAAIAPDDTLVFVIDLVEISG